jgi:hypothetical protein
MNNYDFDFGFTAVNEEELKVVKEAKKNYESVSEEIDNERKKTYTMYNMIMPLLNNLAKNPEKNYIYWEGTSRLQKIEQFRDKLDEVLNS